jgi:hypothetical protein
MDLSPKSNKPPRPRSQNLSIMGEGFQASLARLGGQGALTKDDRAIEEQISEFVTAVGSTKEALKRLNRGLLRPRSTFVQTWDMVTASGLLYTLFVTPFEVGMDLPATVDGGLAVLFVLNQLITLIFAFDIVVNFLLPVPTGFHGGYERRHWALARRYLKSWFFLDLCAHARAHSSALAGTAGTPRARASVSTCRALAHPPRAVSACRALTHPRPSPSPPVCVFARASASRSSPLTSSAWLERCRRPPSLSNSCALRGCSSWPKSYVVRASSKDGSTRSRCRHLAYRSSLTPSWRLCSCTGSLLALARELAHSPHGTHSLLPILKGSRALCELQVCLRLGAHSEASEPADSLVRHPPRRSRERPDPEA